jgi:hypothetical protein
MQFSALLSMVYEGLEFSEVSLHKFGLGKLKKISEEVVSKNYEF